MTARERRDVRARLVSYMEYHPLSMPAVKRRVQVQPLRVYARRVAVLFGTQTVRFRPLIGAAAVLLMIVVPVAAEKALPGDTLYPVKVHFNEGIRSQLTFSPYEKIQWEATRVERRIGEARLLAQEGKLTEENESELEATVREHATAAKAQLAELRESDAEGAAIAEVTLQSAFDVQSLALDSEEQQQASTTVSNESSITGIAAIVRAARSDVASSTQVDTSVPSYARLVTRVEEDTTRIRALIQSIGNGISDEQKADIKERVTLAEEDVVRAKDMHESDDDTAAIQTLREALARTQKLIAFMSDFGLRSRVSIATLVPQPITEAMLREDLDNQLVTLSAREVSLKATLTSSSTDEVAGKTKEPFAELKTILADLKVRIEAGAYGDAQVMVTNAKERISVLEGILGVSTEGEVTTASTTDEIRTTE